MTIGVDPVTGVAGLIWPGDLVDVILTQEFDPAQVTPAKRVLSETVLTGIRVIAVDQDIVQGGPPTGTSGARDEDRHGAGHRGPGRTCWRSRSISAICRWRCVPSARRSASSVTRPLPARRWSMAATFPPALAHCQCSPAAHAFRSSKASIAAK